MSDIRRTVLAETQILLATERGLRPDDFSKTEGEPSVCPFCPGNEHLTPLPERLRFASGNGSWELRVVPNRFPAARIEGKTNFVLDARLALTIADAHGAHEVIIETPDHNQDITALPLHRLVNLFQAIATQTIDLYRDPRIRFIQVFKNHGKEAGASLSHPHTQLIGLPQIPVKIDQRLHRLRLYESDHGHSIFEMVIEKARENNRVVIETPHFIAITPYEAKFPFEMWVMPLDKQSHFKDSSDHFNELSEIVSQAFRRLKATLRFLPPFNVVLDEAPANIFTYSELFYRWRWRIYPRITRIAGFELATGFYINPTPPEQAASFLREAQI